MYEEEEDEDDEEEDEEVPNPFQHRPVKMSHFFRLGVSMYLHYKILVFQIFQGSFRCYRNIFVKKGVWEEKV